MKNKKNLVYLIIALIVLVAAAILLNLDSGSSYKMKTKFFTVDSANVDKIELEKNGKKIILEKKGIGWQLTAPIQYIAYQPFVATALGELKNMKLISIASKNPDNKDKYGFGDTSVTKVSVYQSGNLLGSFLLGIPLSSAAQMYAKDINGTEIYVADGIVGTTIVKGEFINEWRDKKMLSLSKSTIKSVKLIQGVDSFEITIDSTGKYSIGKDSVNSSQAEGVVNLFQDFNTQTYKDTIIGSDLKADYSIEIKADKDYVINFYQYGDKENPRFMIKISGNDQIFDIDKNFFGTIFKKRKDLIVTK